MDLSAETGSTAARRPPAPAMPDLLNGGNQMVARQGDAEGGCRSPPGLSSSSSLGGRPVTDADWGAQVSSEKPASVALCSASTVSNSTA